MGEKWCYKTKVMSVSQYDFLTRVRERGKGQRPCCYIIKMCRALFVALRKNMAKVGGCEKALNRTIVISKPLSCPSNSHGFMEKEHGLAIKLDRWAVYATSPALCYHWQLNGFSWSESPVLKSLQHHFGRKDIASDQAEDSPFCSHFCQDTKFLTRKEAFLFLAIHYQHPVLSIWERKREWT